MKELKQYYRQIQSWLPCGGKIKRQMMASITANIEGYLAEHPQTDFAALQSHFGTPQQIATAFVDGIETEELLKTLRIRRKVLRAIIVFLILLFAVYTIALLSLWLAGLLSQCGNLIIDSPIFHN